jgi:hypothetical protein
LIYSTSTYNVNFTSHELTDNGHVVVPEVVRVIAGAGQEATRDLAVDHVTAPDPDLDLERGAGADHAALIKILDLDRAVVLLLKKTETPQRKIRTNLV